MNAHWASPMPFGLAVGIVVVVSQPTDVMKPVD
jgi:hypothetical protein